jgi:hypothetical protein
VGSGAEGGGMFLSGKSGMGWMSMFALQAESGEAQQSRPRNRTDIFI